MYRLKDKFYDEMADDGGEGGGGASTILNPGDGGEGGEDTAGKWPEQWRDEFLAGIPDLDDEGKEKELAVLGRFQSPGEIYKSFRESQAKISAGLNATLPDNATEEDIKVYREANGIPIEFSGYHEGLKEGAISEENKPLFDDFFEHVFHANNVPKEAASKAVEWWDSMQRAREAQVHETDVSHQTAVEDGLRDEWGKEYRTNIGVVNNFLAKIPKASREGFVNARLPDGRALMNDPVILKHLVSIERSINPASTLTEGDTDGVANMESRIAEIEGKMNTQEYRKSEKMQEEYRQLLRMREKVNAQKK